MQRKAKFLRENREKDSVSGVIANHNKIMGKLQLPPGYRFIPTDELLIVHYLQPKVEGRTLNCSDYIFDVNNIYDYKDPSELFDEILQNSSNGPYTSNGGESGDQILYFFSTLKPCGKAASGRNKQRAVGNGTWSGQARPVKIFSPGTENVIGHRKDFSFEWKDNPVTNVKRRKTDSSASGRWLMNEYSPLDSFYQDNNNKKEYVLCRIKRIKRGKRSFESTEQQLQIQSVPSPPVPVPVQSASLPAASEYEIGSSSSTQSSVNKVGSSVSAPSSANMVQEYVPCRIKRIKRGKRSFESTEPQLQIQSVPPSPPVPVPVQSASLPAASVYEIGSSSVNEAGSSVSAPSSVNMVPLILMSGIPCGFYYAPARMEPLILCDMNGFNYSSANIASSQPEEERSGDDNLQSVAPTTMSSSST